MKIIQYLLLILLTFGCKSKQISTDTYTDVYTDTNREVKTVFDTIIIEREVIKTLPVYSETIIETPCDEFGKIKPIYTTIGSGGNRSSVKTVNGALVIQQYIDSTKQQNELIKQLRFENDSLVSVIDRRVENVQTSEIVRYVWPWWIYALMIGCILFAGLWVYAKFFMPRLY